jgi:hypothetical protein
MFDDIQKEFVEVPKGVVPDSKVACNRCNATTLHEHIYGVHEKLNYDCEIMAIDCTYSIIQCRGCRELSFRRDISFADGTDEHATLFPQRIAGRQSLDKYLHIVPPEVSAIYSEARSAFCNDLRILSGIAIRALIEAVCKHKNASGGNLAKKIDDLVRLGVLTAESAMILHELRFLGNEAAHEIKPHDAYTLGIAMDIAEHMLMAVYVIPEQAKRLKEGPPKMY